MLSHLATIPSQTNLSSLQMPNEASVRFLNLPLVSHKQHPTGQQISNDFRLAQELHPSRMLFHQLLTDRRWQSMSNAIDK